MKFRQKPIKTVNKRAPQIRLSVLFNFTSRYTVKGRPAGLVLTESGPSADPSKLIPQKPRLKKHPGISGDRITFPQSQLAEQPT